MSNKVQALDYEGVVRSGRVKQADDATLSNPRGHLVLDSPDTAVALVGTGKQEAPALIESEKWVNRSGHSLTFACLFLFTIVLYFRPYELFPALASLNTMAFYVGLVTLAVYAGSQLALEGNLTARPKEVNLVLIMGLAAVLSIPLAVNPPEAWKEFNELFIKTILIFIVIVNVLRTERRLKLLFILAICVSIYLSVNAIADYRSGVFKLGMAETNNLRIEGSIKGLFDNSNDLALHLVTIIPIALALAFEKRGYVRKIVYISTALLMIAAVITTFSRGGFLGLIAVTLVLARKLGRRNPAATVGVLVLAFMFFLLLAPATYSGRLSTIFDSGSDITGSSSQRTQVLKRSIVVALRYPLFGVGIGNFHHKSFQELGTHNAYTQVAAETGIVAMIAYIMFLVHPIRKLRRIEQQLYERNEFSRLYYIAIGIQASLVGYMVASFFAAVAYQWYIYYLVGYAIAIRRIWYLQESAKKPGANLLERTSVA